MPNLVTKWPTLAPPNGGTVPLASELGLAGVLETFGGALLLVGLFTRPIAFVLAGEMAVSRISKCTV